MGTKVVQLTSGSYYENLLSSLHQLRLLGHLSDVTVKVDYQGDAREFRAHQVMLAASSGYFKDILLSREEDAAKDELLLSNMHPDNFSKFVEFAYTGKVEVARDEIGDVQAAAYLLDCKDLSQVCREAMSAGVLQKKPSVKKKNGQATSEAVGKGRPRAGKKKPKSVFLKRQLATRSTEKEVIPKRPKAANGTAKKTQATKLKLTLAGGKVVRRRITTKAQSVDTGDDGEDGDVGEDEGAEEHEDRTKKGRTRGSKKPKSVSLKRQLSPQNPDKDVVPKRAKAANEKAHNAKKTGGSKLTPNLAGRKVLNKRGKKTKGQSVDNGDKEQDGDAEVRPKMEEDEAMLGMPLSGEEDWGFGDNDDDDDDHEGSLTLSLGDGEEGEVEEGEEGQSKKTIKKSSKAQFECDRCQRTFHYERSYLKHISTYHGVTADIVYRCETCQQTFANRSNLKIHEKHVHSSERLFTCQVCAKTFKRRKDVVRHQRQVHERTNSRFVCTECGKTLSSKTALVFHERMHSGLKPFECTDCGAKFSQNSALKMHRRTHTGEKPFACDLCESRFTQKHMLAYHKRSHTGEKPFMCEACGKSFASKEYLRHHSNIHTGSKPYKCEQCDRVFTQRNSLHQHLKIHTGERPYKCKDCEKQFTQLNALQRHQRIHTGEKPYMCGLCKRTFTDKSTLRRHTMVHNTSEPWKTYLVVLEGNVEDKKPKSPTKGKAEKAGAGDNTNAYGDASATTATTALVKTQPDPAATPAQPTVTLPSDWSSHGAMALVHMIQPLVTTDASGASVISLDASSIPVPFSIPVSMAHPLSVPIPESTLAPSDIQAVPTVSSVLEAAVSQTILAPVSDTNEESSSGMGVLPPDVKTVVVTEQHCEKQPISDHSYVNPQ